MNYKLIFLTALTMIAFAANSILCRLALVNSSNSPASFTMIRLFAGAAILFFFFLKDRKNQRVDLSLRSFLAPLMLFSYALFFSLSYVHLTAGTGALILFSCVQLTMMFVAFLRGQKMSGQEKLGVALAVSGFLYLMMPGVSMPPMGAAALMILAGVSWGIYSLLGQAETNPIFATARNFLFTIPMISLLGVFFPFSLTSQGVFLAIVSGAVTSGMGYVLWYLALRKLQTSTAALVQLSTPALAAFGGILFLGENVRTRLLVASLLIFCGITLKVKK